ncbi:hypothetical protein A9X77_00110 [Brachyspira hyodysenteriae]|uniref:hypothetical protein n=1 Tax=Brachyspira hyodysenteriae TaxID=159 RepID=UPI00063DB656|nr:hypothetical protein [Brachyspira hyodysenteriae]KLI27032.1 hypothetical protein SR30_03865 [Brachyspira hyodysenteriae]TVL75304.1 hypothetical protein A9X77_00110 [Brachyspira hyodysenteriae]TVL85784.1 hypothetical protein A9X78_01550 [Brachyspira hyodysenteriae]
MEEELFSRKESVKDIFNIIETKLKQGLFTESMEDFDRIMSKDFECANLYENISCVKFWINRLDKFKSVERNCIEYCKLLDSTYKKFNVFVHGKSYDENLISINAIHYYVYNKIIELIMQRSTNGIEGTEELHLLSNAFIELKDYSRALKSYEYLNTIEPYNSRTLSYIAMIYDKLGDEKKCKMYIREALFYDPLSIEFENISIEVVREIRDIIIKRGIHNNSQEEIILWMSAYGELMNILDVKRPLNEQEEFDLRRNISRLEADYRKIKLRETTAPKLLSSYAFLTTYLIMRQNDSDVEEVKVWGRKMAVIDKDLLQYYIKILDKE